MGDVELAAELFDISELFPCKKKPAARHVIDFSNCTCLRDYLNGLRDKGR